MFLLVFCIGICIGSFINVLIDRITLGTFFSKSRSYCDYCKKELKWYDLIPLLSFMLLRGRCRYCHEKISNRVPLVEIITGLGFCIILSMSAHLSPITILLYCVLFSLFVALFFIDAERLIIPDILLFVFIIISLLLHLVGQHSILEYILSAVGAFVFFLILFLLTKGKGMGFGDVKFAGVLGFYLGFPHIITALYSAFLIGAVVAITLVVLKRKKLKGSIISFGPFMILGVLVAVLFSDFIIQTFF